MPEVGGNIKPGTGSAERSAGTPSDGEEGGGTVRDVTAILVGVLFVHTILAGFRVCCSPCHFSRVQGVLFPHAILAGFTLPGILPF